MRRIIRNVTINILFGILIVLLSSCGDIGNDNKSAEELKAEYLKKEQKEKAIQQEKDRIRRGELTFAEAIEAMYKRHIDDICYSDVIRFYDQGHYYKGFYSVRCTKYSRESAGIVHNPNCPCFKDKLK